MLKWNMKVKSELLPTEMLEGEPRNTGYKTYHSAYRITKASHQVLALLQG